MSLGVFLLALGATARITRLITRDYLLRWPRAAAIRRWGPDNDFAYLLACPWCASVWVAGPVFALAWLFGHTPPFVIAAGALTASWLYAVVAAEMDPA